MSMAPFLGSDPWLAVLVTDPRVAMNVAQSLRGAERRIDGPFSIWDGKAGTLPVSILVAEPGGGAAWFAAARLAMRRFRPTFFLGATTVWWCSDDPPPEAVLATDIVDLTPIESILASIEPTATERLPDRVTACLPEALSPRFEAADTVRAFHALLSRSPSPSPVESGPLQEGRPTEKPSIALPSSDIHRLSGVRFGFWNRKQMESHAVARWLDQNQGITVVDRESLGLAESLEESAVPWVVLGECRPLDDPNDVANAPQGRWSRSTKPDTLASLLSWGITSLSMSGSQSK